VPTNHQLKLFLAVADHGGIRLAADALGISQPSISKQLSSLEHKMGGELFLRSPGKPLTLSARGTSLLDDARRAVESARIVAERAATLTRQSAPKIFIRYFMLDTLRGKLEHLYAGGLSHAASFTLVDDTEDIVSRVEEEPGSFGLMRTDQASLRPSIAALLLRKDPCALYAAPQLAERLRSGDLRPQELSIILPSKGNGLRPWVGRFLDNAGYGAGNILDGPAIFEMGLQRVLDGACASVFMDWFVADLVAGGRLVKIEPFDEALRLLLITHASTSRRALQQLGAALSGI